MIALDTRWLARASPLYYETLDPPLGKVHRQAQADRAATDDQNLSVVGFAQTRFTLSCAGDDSKRAPPKNLAR